jgi:hypothetical protein
VVLLKLNEKNHLTSNCAYNDAGQSFLKSQISKERSNAGQTKICVAVGGRYMVESLTPKPDIVKILFYKYLHRSHCFSLCH